MTEEQPVERMRRRELKERTRRRLIDAAGRVFAAKGFASATVEDVAEAAGFTKGAVYSNFARKTDLFLALIEHRIDEQVRTARQALAGRTLEDAMRSLETQAAAIWPDKATTQWLLLVAEFWLHAMRDTRVRQALAEQYERARTYSTQMIAAKYVEAGTDPPMPPRDIAIVVEALGVGLGFQAAIDPGAVPMGLQAEVLRRLLGGSTASPAEGGGTADGASGRGAEKPG